MNRYSSFRNQPLTDEQIHRRAPSVFAEEKHESRSERYTYIPTSQVLAGLRREGFEVYDATQGRSRVPGKAEFTKHVLRLRKPDANVEKIGDSIYEIVLGNSHDGTSAYWVEPGLYRVVCMNGLIAKSDSIRVFKVPHKGDIVNNVIDATYSVVDQGETVFTAIEDMRATEVEPFEAQIFATAAQALRYPEDPGFQPQELLRPRRQADIGNDLWLTFNRVQENLMRGGQVRRNRVTADGKHIRDTRSKALSSIDQDTRINRALWTMAEMLREHREKAA